MFTELERESGAFSVRWLHAVVMDLRFVLFPELPSLQWDTVRYPRFVVRRHAGKLVRWADGESGWVDDLEWRWLPGLRDDRLAEVVIRDPLGAFAGVRHTFFVGDRLPVDRPRIIWGLGVWPLSADEGPLPQFVIEAARLRSLAVLERGYCDFDC